MYTNSYFQMHLSRWGKRFRGYRDDRPSSDGGPRFEHYEEPQKIAEVEAPAKYDAGPAQAPRPRSPLRGWTLTYIANPRELVNQYGTETNTTIFDLKDHTPKKYVVTKEWVSRKEAGPEFEAEE
uniref:Uncharacterized protein n=1 Tax=Acrobeloides nanus TaxID=290746 RepID=A0A914DZ88_9BILA